MTHQEVGCVLGALPEDSDRLVMIGVLVSSKTIRGEANKWPMRYPVPDALCRIFPSYEYQNLLNLLHFNTKEPEKLFEQMCVAQELAGPYCHGFQLNIAWPHKNTLKRYLRFAAAYEKKIVLQCGGKALDLCGRSPAKIAERVREYEGLVEYVLIDPSGGLGQEFDLTFAANCFRELQKVESIGFGIAGGLHADNLDRLRPLLREFPDFSIDAEGRLRDADDNLDIDKARAYLKAADVLFREYAPTA